MAKQPRSVAAPSRLGRGLSSLISSGTEPAAARQPRTEEAGPTAPPPPPGPLEIPVADIRPNPYQPRREFDEQALAELAASIRQQGILQPLLVAKGQDDGRGYTLVAGERRLRAATQAGLDTVPCVVKEPSQREMLEWSLIENTQRSDLNAIERARAYRDYMGRFELTQAAVAERTGEGRATVANYLRLLDLPEEVHGLIVDGSITTGHAKALASLAGQADRQVAIARRIASEGLSVRHVEQLVSQPAKLGEPKGDTRPAAAAKPAYIADLERQLAQTIGTRVRIKPGRGKNRGRIVIDYYSLDDFDRIAEALGLEPEA